MNFIEAVQALVDGRCTRIKRSGFGEEFFRNGALGVRECEDNTPVTTTLWLLADDWEMVDPRPQYETVQLERWVQVNLETGMTEGGLFTAPVPTGKRFTSVRVTGAYEREVKPKVKRQVELAVWSKPVEEFKGATRLVSFPDGVPNAVKVFAEWEEDS